MLDSAVRAHRKHMTSIQSAVSNVGLAGHVKAQTPPPPLPSPDLSLHKGKYHWSTSNDLQMGMIIVLLFDAVYITLVLY